MKMKKNAQAIAEFLILLTVIAAALGMMQLYFRRSIQSVIKIAADEVGSQKEGAAESDPDMEWFEKHGSDITTNSAGTETETKLLEASVIYGVDETSTQTGVMSYGVVRPKD